MCGWVRGDEGAPASTNSTIETLETNGAAPLISLWTWEAQNRTQTMRRLLVPAFIGAVCGADPSLVRSRRPVPDGFVTFLEALGAIVFAYFVMEELLREAHQVDEHPWTAAMFFVGFIPLFIVAVAISQ
jgi:hypothetical protein